MEPSHQPSFEESIQQVMRTLPPAIRTYIEGEQYAKVAQTLTTKYQLHVDQGGILEREMLLLLLGIENPAEFASALQTETGLKQELVVAIMKDLNQQVFAPLQETMRTGGNEGVPATPKAKPAAAVQSLGTVDNPPMPASIPTMSTPLAEKTLNRLAATPPAGGSTPRPVAPAARPAVVTSGLSAALKNAGVQLLEDHEEPHIEFKKPAAAVAPAAPAAPSAPTSLPKPIMAGSFAAPAPQAPRPPMPAPLPSAPVPMPKPPVPTMPASTTYTVDPYREAPEEHEK